MFLRNLLHPNEHITKARFCAIFSDAWNKSASVERPVKGSECTGIMPFSADIVAEEKFTPASMVEPSSLQLLPLLPLSLLPRQYYHLAHQWHCAL
jgi:hypothetical protein